MCLGILEAFEIYSNLPYRIAMIITITQIIKESERHTPFYFFLFLLPYTHMLVIFHIHKLKLFARELDL